MTVQSLDSTFQRSEHETEAFEPFEREGETCRGAGDFINKILEDGSELDQIIQQFTPDKVRFEREKSGKVEMLERINCKLQDENDGLRERLYETRQKIIQSNLIDIGQVNGQEWFVYSDASTFKKQFEPCLSRLNCQTSFTSSSTIDEESQGAVTQQFSMGIGMYQEKQKMNPRILIQTINFNLSNWKVCNYRRLIATC